MALTESNIQQRAAEELAIKLRLEAHLGRKLRVLFRQMARDLSAIYAATGQTQSATAYEAELIGILKPTYRSAAKKTGSVTRDNIKSAFNGWETKQEPEVDRAIIDFVTEQPVIRAGHITDTNQTELGAAVMSVVIAAGLAGEALTNEQIGRKSATEFARRSMPRADMIAETEVLNAVEGAKFTELAALISLGVAVGETPLTQVVEREWVTVLDTKTRASHVIADGQRRGLKPFSVGNSNLKFPGDTSLGAELSEVINCRCGAHTVVNGAPSAEQIDSRLR